MRKRGFEFISNEQMVKDLNKALEENDNIKLKKEISRLLNKMYDLNSKSLSYVSLKNSIFPSRATKRSAGHDLYLPFNLELKPGEDVKLPLGIKSYMMVDECLDIFPRSGLGFKYYIRLANTVGLIDSDYYNNKDNEGSIWIKIRNEGSKLMTVKLGEAIAQARFTKYLIADTESFYRGNEREGGMGSTTKDLKEDTFDDEGFVKMINEAREVFETGVKKKNEFLERLAETDLDNEEELNDLMDEFDLDEEELNDLMDEFDLDKKEIVKLDTVNALNFDD